MGKYISKEEYLEQCRAIAQPGLTINGFVEPWNGALTKLNYVCDQHGQSTSVTICNFKTKKGRCGKCMKGHKGEAEFLQVAREAAPEGITVNGCIEPFVNQYTKISLTCALHGDFIKDLKTFIGKPCCTRCTGKKPTEQDYRIRFEALKFTHMHYLHLDGDWKGVRNSKGVFNCPKHGNFKTGLAFALSGGGCKSCGMESIKAAISKDDEHFVPMFFSTGAYDPDTVFTRIDRTSYLVECPVCKVDEYSRLGLCNGVFSAKIDNLKKGAIPCRCSNNPNFSPAIWEYRISNLCKDKGYTFTGWATANQWGSSAIKICCPKHGDFTTTPQRLEKNDCPVCKNKSQQQAYITIIGDRNGFFDLKFGIAKESLKRLKEQRYKATSLRLLTEAIYDFPTVEACKSAERAVKQRLADYVGSVPAVLMPDGHSETLPIGFMDQVKAIYLEFGGVLQKPSLKRPKRLKARKSKSVLLTT